jgi:hypothetical protein
VVAGAARFTTAMAESASQAVSGPPIVNNENFYDDFQPLMKGDANGR